MILTYLNTLIIYNFQKTSRNRNRHIAKQQTISKSNEKLLQMNVINELVSDNTQSSHTMIELSLVQWKKYENNSIVVSNLIEDKSMKNNVHIKFGSINMGKNLQLKKKTCVSFGKLLRCKTVLLKNTSGGYMMIVVKKDELLEFNPNLTIIDGSSQEGEANSAVNNNSSGYIFKKIGKNSKTSQCVKICVGCKRRQDLERLQT